MLKIRQSQSGLSIVELMVGLAVGLIVLTAATAIFITSMRGNSAVLRAQKLNHELQTAMDVMSNDIRRAAHWGGAAVGGTNPFTNAATNLSIHTGCVLYTYDSELTAGLYQNLDEGDFFGFRLSNTGVIEARFGAPIASNNSTDTNCAAGNWSELTDPNTVVISALSFTLEGSRCLNTSTGVNTVAAAGATTSPCAILNPVPAAGSLIAETRQVRITLTGRHAADAALTKTLTTAVNVRNDRLYLQP